MRIVYLRVQMRNAWIVLFLALQENIYMRLLERKR